MIFFNNASFGQDECYLQDPASGFTSNPPSLYCGDLADYEPWDPTNTKVKYVNVNLHIMQKLDGSANFQASNVGHMNYLNALIPKVNSHYANFNAPEFEGPTGDPYIDDSRIQFVNKGIYFWQDDDAWNHYGTWICDSDTYDIFKINEENEINIFFYNESDVQLHDTLFSIGGCGMGYGGPSSNYSMQKNFYLDFLNYPMDTVEHGPNHLGGKTWEFIPNLAHEMGHCLYLHHSWRTDQKALFPDLYPQIGSNPGCESDTDLNCSNNTMSYANGRRFLSPNQLGFMHKELIYGWRYDLIDDCDYDASQTCLIDQNETWNIGHSIGGDIIIQNGATLTIECDVFMPNSGKIIVEQGGHLIVDGGYITNKCSGFWRGIYVAGDPSGQGFPGLPGKVTLKNDAKVEYARTALNNFILKPNGKPDYTSTGGYIVATNTLFINNRRDAQFLEYQNFNSFGNAIRDYSRFELCDFIVDNFFITGETPIQSITTYACEGIRIKGCIFKDNRAGGVPRYTKRTAVYVLKSSVRIDDNYAGISNEFNNLGMGVSIVGMGNSLFHNEIKKSEFISCWTGIHIENNKSTEIVLNKFQVTPFPDVVPLYYIPVGIYLDKYADSYFIEQNEFYPVINSTSTTSHFAAGIVANTGNGANIRIQSNKFNHLSIGFESIGKNRYDNAPSFTFTGIGLYCNEFTNNKTDIYMGKVSGLTSEQGICKDQGYPTILDLPFNSFANQGEINIANDVDLINYWYDNTSAPDEYPNITYFPSNVILSDIPVNSGDSDKCPYDIDNGLVESNNKKSSASSSREAKEQEMTQVLDGGDTDGLQTDVALTSNTEAWNQYVELMSKAGYITEIVLNELVTNEIGFSEAMTRNVLVANPHAAKSIEISESLDNRSIPLPQYMRDQIEMGLTQISPKEFLQMQKDGYKRKQDRMTNIIHHTLTKDSIPENGLTMMISNFSNNEDINFDYKLVELYDDLNQEELSNALLTIMNQYDNLTENKQSELERYIAFRSMTNNWTLEAGDEFELTDIQLDLLEDYLFIDDRVSAKATILLKMNNVLENDLVVILPEDEDKSLGSIKDNLEEFNAVDGQLRLYPNPAKDYFTIEYKVEKHFEEGLINLFDSKGILVYEKEIVGLQDQILFTKSKIPNLSNGIYQCSLTLDGEIYKSTSIILE